MGEGGTCFAGVDAFSERMTETIERLELIERARAVLHERHLLVEAPAGYGKSVLLQQLVPYLPGSVYLRLTIDDDDVAVLRQRVRSAGHDTLLLDDVHLLSAAGEAAAWLRDQLADSERKFIVAGRYLPFQPALLLAERDATR